MNIVQTLGKLKIWLTRASGYIALGNLGMLSYLFIKNTNLDISIWVAFPLALLLFIGLGWFDEFSGIHQAENRRANTNNPQIIEILEIVKRLENKKL